MKKIALLLIILAGCVVPQINSIGEATEPPARPSMYIQHEEGITRYNYNQNTQRYESGRLYLFERVQGKQSELRIQHANDPTYNRIVIQGDSNTLYAIPSNTPETASLRVTSISQALAISQVQDTSAADSAITSAGNAPPANAQSTPSHLLDAQKDADEAVSNAGPSDPAQPDSPISQNPPPYGRGQLVPPAESAKSATPTTPPAIPEYKGNTITVGKETFTWNDVKKTYALDSGGKYKEFVKTSEGYILTERDSAGNAIGQPQVFKLAQSATASSSVIVDPAVEAQIAAAREDTRLFAVRKTEGSKLTSSEVNALTNAKRSEAPDRLFISKETGLLSNDATNGIAVPPALINSITGETKIKGSSSDWSFVKSEKQEWGVSFKNQELFNAVTTITGPASWTESTTTERRYCGLGCDSKSDPSKWPLEKKSEKSVQYDSILVGDEKIPTKAKRSETTKFFEVNKEGTAAVEKSSVNINYINKAELESRTRESAEFKELDSEDQRKLLEEIGKLPNDYRKKADIVVEYNDGSSRKKFLIDENGDYFETTDGKTKGKELTGDEKSAAQKKAGDEAVRNAHDETLDRGIKGVSVGPFEFGLVDTFKTLGFARSLGFLMRAYEQYRGLTQITTITWAPGWNREALAREFCLGAGIENCLTSTICGEIHEITADNVLAGRGPQGELTSSAALNAQRSQPIIMKDLTRQQLLDILGNTTVVKGRRVDLTDPSFDPSTLGNVTIRLYHVEFSVTNSVQDEEDLRFNLEFRRSSPVEYVAPPRRSVSSIEDVQGDIQQFFSSLPSSSYGEAVSTAKWFPSDQTLNTGLKAHDHKYKYSTNEYDTACLTFDPGLPSEGANSGGVASELCVPFREYVGGPQKIEGVAPEQRRPGAQNSPSAPARPQPEGLSV